MEKAESPPVLSSGETVRQSLFFSDDILQALIAAVGSQHGEGDKTQTAQQIGHPVAVAADVHNQQNQTCQTQCRTGQTHNQRDSFHNCSFQIVDDVVFRRPHYKGKGG